jgi:hypothetical protein
MPHVSDYRVQPEHDTHDRLLVAALAAGDLAGTDRDHARQLTRSCAECAQLHDDLLAIARATAVVPPPVVARPRDFQLPPADAARLRPAGWRRLVVALGTARLAATRPLGVGLATFGLVGLLLANAPILSLGSGSAASPATAPAAEGANDAAGAAGAAPRASARDVASVPAPVASAAASMAPAAGGGDTFGSAAGASPSTPPRTAAEHGPSAVPVAQVPGGSAGASGGGAKSGPDEAGPADLVETPPAESANGLRPFNLLFAQRVVAGRVLLAAGTIRSRRPR